MKTQRAITHFLMFLLPISIGCFKQKTGSVADTKLFLVADSTNWLQLEPSLREVFERVIVTPQPEKVFEVHWVPPRSWDKFAMRKNLVLLGILDSEGEIDRKVADMLAPQVLAKVEDGSAFYFLKQNPWVEGQLLVVLAAMSSEDLAAKLRDNKSQLYRHFHKKLIEETKASMYARMEQDDLARQFLEKYGWTLRVQHDYFINIERTDEPFIMLRRSLPERERWLFVHWIEEADPAEIDQSFAMNMRDRLTTKFYEGDVINRDYTSSRYVEFAGRNALMVEGLWENVEKVAGGPFRNYSFYDEETGRIYMVDVAVFFPGGEKEPFLRQLDVMAHTFKTANDVKNKTEEEAS